MKLKIYVDEAWRWPLAWPVYTGLFLAIEKFDYSSFQDSKKLSEKKRKEVYNYIQDLEKQWKVLYTSSQADSSEIDKYWISKAINLAISRWIFILLHKYFNLIKNNIINNFWDNLILVMELEKLFQTKTVTYKIIKQIIDKISLIEKFDLIIDWNTDFWLKKDLGISPITIIDGDAKVPFIWAASIIAKVERDEFMTNISKKYPKYWFEKHKWYGSKLHTESIKKYWLSKVHRTSFANKTIWKENTRNYKAIKVLVSNNVVDSSLCSEWHNIDKPKLLIHICCAPDLAWPLKFLKEYFKLVLFWYNPNIHPYNEHKKRYDEYIKLLELEPWEYEIIDETYNPKEFFEYLFKDQERTGVKSESFTEYQKTMSSMTEHSKRCDSCYYMRLEKPSEYATKYNVPYFTSTLLISPKKDLDKLYKYGIEAQNKYNGSKFLFFDFRKNWWYLKSCEITKELWLRRQNYCGCVWTIPKK